MGVPRGDEESGKIEINGNVYGLLGALNWGLFGIAGSPLCEEYADKIYTFGQKLGCSFNLFFRRENDTFYLWSIEDDKFFLKEVSFARCKKYSYVNMIEKIFGKKKLFASWFSGELKAVVRSEDIGDEDHYLFDRDIILITIKEGRVVDMKEKHEVARGIVLKLRNYLEE